MLILLGILNLTGAMRWISHKLSPTHPAPDSSQAATQDGGHSHIHFHGAQLHVHPHSHSAAEGSNGHHANEVDPPHWLQAPFVQLGWFHSLRPLFIGIVHGLAGSAAVALLVLGTIRQPKWAILYLLIFGVGTIVGMMLMTLAFAVPFTVAGKREPRHGYCHRAAQCCVWIGRGLPDRLPGRTLLAAAFVDASLTPNSRAENYLEASSIVRKIGNSFTKPDTCIVAFPCAVNAASANF